MRVLAERASLATAAAMASRWAATLAACCWLTAAAAAASRFAASRSVLSDAAAA